MRSPDDPLDPAPLDTATHTLLERLFSLPAGQLTPAELRCCATS